MWRDVARCGAMWRDVVQWGAMWCMTHNRLQLITQLMGETSIIINVCN
jgi:hypothetical protein